MKPSFITARALGLECSRIVPDTGGGCHLEFTVRLRRFWLPFFLAEVTPWWWAKPVTFAWACWRFWVLRQVLHR